MPEGIQLYIEIERETTQNSLTDKIIMHNRTKNIIILFDDEIALKFNVDAQSYGND